MTKFLIYSAESGDEPPVIVNAENEESALKKYRRRMYPNREHYLSVLIDDIFASTWQDIAEEQGKEYSPDHTEAEKIRFVELVNERLGKWAETALSLEPEDWPLEMLEDIAETELMDTYMYLACVPLSEIKEI